MLLPSDVTKEWATIAVRAWLVAVKLMQVRSLIPFSLFPPVSITVGYMQFLILIDSPRLELNI